MIAPKMPPKINAKSMRRGNEIIENYLPLRQICGESEAISLRGALTSFSGPIP
jgi:hypothetical protein